MPGQLKPLAWCPRCNEETLAAIVDTSNSEGVTREYFHEKPHSRVRRKRRCIFHFTNHDAAAAERRTLEVPQRKQAG